MSDAFPSLQVPLQRPLHPAVMKLGSNLCLTQAHHTIADIFTQLKNAFQTSDHCSAQKKHCLILGVWVVESLLYISHTSVNNLNMNLQCEWTYEGAPGQQEGTMHPLFDQGVLKVCDNSHDPSTLDAVCSFQHKSAWVFAALSSWLFHRGTQQKDCSCIILINLVTYLMIFSLPSLETGNLIALFLFW